MSATISFLIINLIGGTAVLGGYAGFLYMFPEQRDSLWGGIEGGWQWVFIVSMLTAAAGYLCFSYSILFQSTSVEFSSRLFQSKHAISILSMVFLLTAAVWLPATIAYLESGNAIWWVIGVGSLWVTALTLVTTTILLIVTPAMIPDVFHRILAISGISYITFHCLVLDAIVWVSLFSRE